MGSTPQAEQANPREAPNAYVENYVPTFGVVRNLLSTLDPEPLGGHQVEFGSPYICGSYIFTRDPDRIGTFPSGIGPGRLVIAPRGYTARPVVTDSIDQSR